MKLIYQNLIFFETNFSHLRHSLLLLRLRLLPQVLHVLEHDFDGFRVLPLLDGSLCLAPSYFLDLLIVLGGINQMHGIDYRVSVRLEQLLNCGNHPWIEPVLVGVKPVNDAVGEAGLHGLLGVDCVIQEKNFVALLLPIMLREQIRRCAFWRLPTLHKRRFKMCVRRAVYEGHVVEEGIPNTNGATADHGNNWLFAFVYGEEHVNHRNTDSILLILVQLFHVLDLSKSGYVTATGEKPAAVEQDYFDLVIILSLLEQLHELVFVICVDRVEAFGVVELDFEETWVRLSLAEAEAVLNDVSFRNRLVVHFHLILRLVIII